jgi:hypothetical protein
MPTAKEYQFKGHTTTIVAQAGALVVTASTPGIQTTSGNGGPDYFINGVRAMEFNGSANIIPANKLWFVHSMKQVGSLTVANFPGGYTWGQHFFAYGRVVNNGVPNATSPNFFNLSDNGDNNAGQTGTYVAWGSDPSDTPIPTFPVGWDVTQYEWTVPLPWTTSIYPQIGSGVGVGNSLINTVTFSDSGAVCNEIRITGSITQAESPTTFLASAGYLRNGSAASGVVPAGKEWVIAFAFMNSDSAFDGTVNRVSDGYVLVQAMTQALWNAKATTHVQTQGGYGTPQADPKHSLTGAVYPNYIVLQAGDDITFYANATSGPSSGNVGYMVMAAEVPAGTVTGI